MIKAYFDIPVCAELTAMLVACVCVRNKQQPFWLLFILFLTVTSIVEAAGTFFEVSGMYDRNHILYNIFMLGQAGFFGLLFYRFTSGKNMKSVLFVSAFLFAIIYAVETIIFPFSRYHMYSRMALSGITVLCSCIFYASLLGRSDLKTPLRYPPFWIITGLFFYYFVSLPLFAFYKTVSAIRLIENLTVYDLVIDTLNIILYGCWVIAFIWKKREI